MGSFLKPPISSRNIQLYRNFSALKEPVSTREEGEAVPQGPSGAREGITDHKQAPGPVKGPSKFSSKLLCDLRRVKSRCVPHTRNMLTGIFLLGSRASVNPTALSPAIRASGTSRRHCKQCARTRSHSHSPHTPHSHTHTHKHTRALSHALSHTLLTLLTHTPHTHTFTHSLTLLTHTHSHTPHSHTHTCGHSLTLFSHSHTHSSHTHAFTHTHTPYSHTPLTHTHSHTHSSLTYSIHTHVLLTLLTHTPNSHTHSSHMHSHTLTLLTHSTHTASSPTEPLLWDCVHHLLSHLNQNPGCHPPQLPPEPIHEKSPKPPTHVRAFSSTPRAPRTAHLPSSFCLSFSSLF